MQDNNYANQHSRMNIVDERLAKAAKIYAVLSDYLKDTSSLTVLDLGCSRGTILFSLAPMFRKAIGIDLDKSAILFAQENYQLDNLSFLHADVVQKIPVADSSVDVLVCNQVYNYVEEKKKFMSEILRVLKPMGVCYFAGVNFYKRDYAGSPTWPMNYFSLKSYFRHFFVHDYTVRILKNPEKYQRAGRFSFIRHLPVLFLKILLPFFPSWVFILERKQ